MNEWTHDHLINGETGAQEKQNALCERASASLPTSLSIPFLSQNLRSNKEELESLERKKKKNMWWIFPFSIM